MFEAQREEISNAIKANYEKILNQERTLKTQVSVWQCIGMLNINTDKHTHTKI